MARIIKSVESNNDKRDTFRILKGRYKKAIKNEFYFEAMSIAYALIEDRLKAFLYYSAAIDDRNSFKITRKKGRKEQLQMIAKNYPDNKGNISLGINAIKGKIRIVKALILWAQNTNGEIEDKYLNILKAEYSRCIDSETLITCLEKISYFCDYRNEVVHAAFNKNLLSLYGSIADQLESVMMEEQFLEKEINNLKKRNKIRNTMNLGNN